MLYYAKISGERLQDHWSSGLIMQHKCLYREEVALYSLKRDQLYDLSCVARKAVFGVSDQVQHKPGYTVTETS